MFYCTSINKLSKIFEIWSYMSGNFFRKIPQNFPKQILKLLKMFYVGVDKFVCVVSKNNFLKLQWRAIIKVYNVFFDLLSTRYFGIFGILPRPPPPPSIPESWGKWRKCKQCYRQEKFSTTSFLLNNLISIPICVTD